MVDCADGPTTVEAKPERFLSPDVWSQPVISVFGRLINLGYMVSFQVCLGYIIRPCVTKEKERG